MKSFGFIALTNFKILTTPLRIPTNFCQLLRINILGIRFIYTKSATQELLQDNCVVSYHWTKILECIWGYINARNAFSGITNVIKLCLVRNLLQVKITLISKKNDIFEKAWKHSWYILLSFQIYFFINTNIFWLVNLKENKAD